MAGDWIMLDHELPQKPEFMAIMGKTGEEPATILGRLAMLWCLVDRQTLNGVLPHVTLASLGCMFGGDQLFWQAVSDVGWLSVSDAGLAIPNFEHRFSNSARKRMLHARQVADTRTTRAQEAHKPRTRSAQEAHTKRTAGAQQAHPVSVSESESISHTQGETPPPPGGNLEELRRLETEFVAAWNQTEGVTRCRTEILDGKRRKHFRARAREDGWDWRAALAKFPLRCTLNDPDPWRPDLDWFLKPGSVGSILEGKYDWAKGDKRGGGELTFDGIKSWRAGE